MVGFYPRLHTLAPGTSQRYEYHSWWYVWWYGEYSMVLTKAALLHRRYLAVYSTTMSAAVPLTSPFFPTRPHPSS